MLSVHQSYKVTITIFLRAKRPWLAMANLPYKDVWQYESYDRHPDI